MLEKATNRATGHLNEQGFGFIDPLKGKNSHLT